jgi:hypothetical protein
MKYYEKCGVSYDFENFREFRFFVPRTSQINVCRKVNLLCINSLLFTLGHPVPGDINTGTWPSKLGESQMRQ